MTENLWAANRCLQLNSQQVASMPLRFYGSPTSTEPAWVSSPDGNWFPNGIGEAVFAAVWSMYAWGDAFLYITARYASGFPSGWTVLKPEAMTVENINGQRRFRYGGMPLDAANVVQITRDPRGGLRGTSALKSHAANAWNLTIGATAAGDILGSAPPAVLKSTRKLTKAQAADIQDQWVERASRRRRGTPPVLPPEIDLVATNLGLSPQDLLLIDSQQYDARVVASAFGVPPFLLNLPLEGGLTYQNPEMMAESWWRFELRPAAKRVSDALTANMLPRGSYVEFEPRETLAPTITDQIASWTKMVEDGIVTADEMRAAVLRLPPVGTPDAIEAVTTPTVAPASPEPPSAANVTTLRPAQEVSL